MIEVYRGSCNSWETDEMGHMNVRFYVARMMEGLAEFACQAGMPHAFRADSGSTLRPRDQHIRFLREALAGKPFHMRAGVLDIADTSCLVYQQIDHASGVPCAAFRTWVDHVDVESGATFPWSRTTRARLEDLRCEAPALLAPRSLDFAVAPRKSAKMADADAVGAPLIGRGIVQPQHCDLLDRMMPEFFIGRVSDSVSNLLGPWREELAARAAARGEPFRTGGAVLEYRIVYRRWPRAGDRFIVRSSLGSVSDKIHSIVHWTIDPDSGDAWCTSEALAVTLNLDTRKIVQAAPEQMEMLKKRIPSGLTV
ncbi:MAG: acyl-ACP thioesterase [Alphaproteobacteria bacterium]|nr:acyl-ACP thioesterase [Alphaproteobacteria bacterium]